MAERKDWQDKAAKELKGRDATWQVPEGFAIGTAYASETAGLSLFVIIAIAVQNIPEGTSVAIPMAASHFTSRSILPAA